MEILVVLSLIALVIILSISTKNGNHIDKSSKQLSLSHDNKNTSLNIIDCKKAFEKLKIKPGYLSKYYSNELCKINVDSDHFAFIWEEVIFPSIAVCQKKITSDFCEECELKSRDYQKYAKALYKVYREKREWLKEIYLYNKVKNGDDAKLDMHKIGAVLSRSVLKEKFFIFDTQKAEAFCQTKEKEFENKKMTNHEILLWYADNIYVNYKLAYLVGVGVAYISYLDSCLERDDNKEAKEIRVEDEKAFELVKKYSRLIPYRKKEEHEGYEISSIIMLMKNDILGRDFDYLNWATNLFQLEEHNKILCSCLDDEKTSDYIAGVADLFS